MVTVRPRFFILPILLAVMPTTGWTQTASSLLTTVAQTMGTENLRTLQYSGSGSMFDENGKHVFLKSYSRTMDFNSSTSTVRFVTADGGSSTEQTVNETVNNSSPWNAQFDFWISPFGFLKGAAANSATMEPKTLFGQAYRVISFTLPGNHVVSGYINNKDMVERVHLTVDDGVSVEAIYHDYIDFSGLKIPTIMIQNRNGVLAQVLVVKDVKPNA